MEFALIVPILLLVVFGIINFGIVFGQTLALNNGARDAARFAVVRQIDGSATRGCGEVLARARDASPTIGMGSENVGVTVSLGSTDICAVAAGQPSSAATGAVAQAPCTGSLSGVNDQLHVTTAFTSKVVVPIGGPPEFNLTGNGYFRCEYS